MTKKIETDIIAELMVAKCDVLQQLCTLMHRQAEHVAAGDMDALMNLLAAKDRLLTKLKPIQASLDPFRSQDPEERLWRTKEDRAECQRAATKCGALLAEIIDLEKQDLDDLTCRRDLVAKKLEGLHVSSKAVQAYQQSVKSPVGRFTSDA
ncbi:MAG: hypothetical protein ABGX22_12845 [Pirellulaceae bacterium]|nr:hypothetical protein [Planctomycetaceae bacterium]